MLSTSIVYSFGSDPRIAATILAVTGAVAFMLYRAFKRRRAGLGAKPQFTRQNMRNRRDK